MVKAMADAELEAASAAAPAQPAGAEEAAAAFAARVAAAAKPASSTAGGLSIVDVGGVVSSLLPHPFLKQLRGES